MLLKASSGEHRVPHNIVLLVTLGGAHIRIIMYLNVYNMKWLWKDKWWNKFRYSCTEQTHGHGDIKKHWRSPVVFIDSFEKIPHLYLVFHCWIWENVVICFYQQRSKYRQVKITKHESTGANYIILTKRVKVKYEKKPIYRIKSIEFKNYADCRFWANIYEIYWEFCSVRIFSL